MQFFHDCVPIISEQLKERRGSATSKGDPWISNGNADNGDIVADKATTERKTAEKTKEKTMKMVADRWRAKERLKIIEAWSE